MKYLLCTVLILFGIVFAQQQPNFPTQVGVPVQCNFGFKHVVTPVITLNDTTPVDLANYIPNNTLGFELRAKSGAFVIAHPENIANGYHRVGRLVEEGETFTWNGLAGKFTGAVLADSGTCELVIDGAWGY